MSKASAILLAWSFELLNNILKQSTIGVGRVSTVVIDIMGIDFSQSKIYVNDHSANPPYPIVDCFKVLFSSSKLRANRIAEALLIKQHKPLINVRYNEMAGGRNVF